MELLFVVLIAAGIGAVLRYSLPRRQSYGMLIVPSIAGSVAAVVWVGLTWLGWAWDGGWIWVVALGAGGVAALVSALVIPRVRQAADERLLHELSGGRA